MCSSCLLFVTFGWSILCSKIWVGVAQTRLRVTRPAHQSVIWLTLLIQREKQKYFTKYSKSIHFVSPRLSHMSVTLNSVKIFINISHDKTDWQIGINIRQLYIPDKHRRKQTFVHKINKRNFMRTVNESMFGFGRKEHLCDYHKTRFPRQEVD